MRGPSSLISEARINTSTAFAYNLMGALFGCVLEYNCISHGMALENPSIAARRREGGGTGCYRQFDSVQQTSNPQICKPHLDNRDLVALSETGE
jgi:hypothetical protein